MAAGAFTGSRSFEFSDAILDSGTGVQTKDDIVEGTMFHPQWCTHVNRSNDSDQDDAGWAIIDGYLNGETEVHRKLWRIDVRRPVGYSFQAIYSAGTTARGIRLVAER